MIRKNANNTRLHLGIFDGIKQQWQNFAGGKLESLGSWVTHLPNRLAEEAANQPS